MAEEQKYLKYMEQNPPLPKLFGFYQHAHTLKHHNPELPEWADIYGVKFPVPTRIVNISEIAGFTPEKLLQVPKEEKLQVDKEVFSLMEAIIKDLAKLGVTAAPRKHYAETKNGSGLVQYGVDISIKNLSGKPLNLIDTLSDDERTDLLISDFSKYMEAMEKRDINIPSQQILRGNNIEAVSNYANSIKSLAYFLHKGYLTDKDILETPEPHNRFTRPFTPAMLEQAKQPYYQNCVREALGEELLSLPKSFKAKCSTDKGDMGIRVFTPFPHISAEREDFDLNCVTQLQQELAGRGVNVTIDTKEVTHNGKKIPQHSLVLQEEGDQAQDRKKAAAMLNVLMAKGWIKEEELYTEGKEASHCAFDAGDLILAKAYPLTSVGARGR
jgi:hypothetical protein